jgi:hypothetical protein
MIRLLKLLRACPDRYKQRAQVPHQVPKPAVMKQTCQHPLLFRFALQRLYTLKHQMFMYMDAWHHRISSFSRPFPRSLAPFHHFQYGPGLLCSTEKCLGDLLPESLRCGVWAHIGKATYSCCLSGV